MTIHSLERVMWRIRSKHPDTHLITPTILKRAIMVECGTSPQTYRNNRQAMIALGWIKTKKKKYIITDEDINGDS